MPASPNGEDERDSQERRRAIIGEVDALLRRGTDPDAAELAARFAEEADRVQSIIEIRKSLFQEGVLDDVAAAPADEPEPLLAPHAESVDRDRALADIKREFQDAMNRGDAPDAIGIVDERPDLKDEVAELSNYYSFMADALKPEFVGPAPEPVQEVVLSHFRLVTMHARHPLGGLFLGVDHHTSRHVELLVIRGQMSKVRSKRMLREALSIRDLGDPAFVPVVDAGEVNDIRFVAWEYPSELSVARVVKRLRRGGGHRFLRDVLDEHSDSGQVSKDPRPPAEEIPIDVPPDAASRLLADPVHVANVLELVAMVAEALDRAHLRGFVFGDLRPDNVFVNHAGQARLRGFGLVHHARAAWHRLGDDSVFLAPEVLADAEPPLDWRADVWGVALIAYALLALKDPPDFSTVDSRAERLFLDLRGSPEALVPLLDRALERDPAARLASCAIMAEELRKMAAALNPAGASRVGAPPVPPAVWYAFLTLVLVAVVTWVLWAVL